MDKALFQLKASVHVGTSVMYCLKLDIWLLFPIWSRSVSQSLQLNGFTIFLKKFTVKPFVLYCVDE